MALDTRLLEILVCPECKGKLEYLTEDCRLLCHQCKLSYKVEDDIPIMLPDQADRI
jgi:uncharacterized protein YbaR (Trm112 family)